MDQIIKQESNNKKGYKKITEKYFCASLNSCVGHVDPSLVEVLTANCQCDYFRPTTRNDINKVLNKMLEFNFRYIVGISASILNFVFTQTSVIPVCNSINQLYHLPACHKTYFQVKISRRG
jgi:hypothetical protein